MKHHFVTLFAKQSRLKLSKGIVQYGFWKFQNKYVASLQIAIEHNRIARAKYSEVWRFDIPCYVCFARCGVQSISKQ